jgi:penicillin V acylase-like amidase (Ntn superfamily)
MKKLLASLLLLLFAGYTFACSTFLLSRNGQHVFGRNYDWVTGNGIINVNARGLSKTSFMPGNSKSVSWTSVYGSVTFNQFGKEFPNGGMNEKGLVVEMMWLNETNYPAADNRTAINELQWIQYQLDNCATIEEVIATDKLIRIDRTAAPLHYLVADSTGQAATIEFINGKLVIHRGNALTYPVLTNTAYKSAVQEYTMHRNNPEVLDNSEGRFAKACNMIQQFQANDASQPPVDYAFDILQKIAQGSFTKWSIVYDITNRQVYFATYHYRQRKQIVFRDIDFSCNNTYPSFDINSSQTGNVYKYFTPLSFEQNKTSLVQSARESGSRITFEDATVAKAAEYFGSIKCQ